MVDWSTDVRSGDWLVARVQGFALNVGSIVPHGFEAYARVFHPIFEDGQPPRWRDLAASNDRLVHAEMQWHHISRPRGECHEDYDTLPPVIVGSLPRRELQLLTDVLARHTDGSTPCWFAVWEGFGQINGGVVRMWPVDGRTETENVPPIAPREVLDGPRMELPNRAYVLLCGELTDAPHLFDLLGAQSPNLWWPEDRSWCVATDIDSGWTYVAGSEALINDVIGCPDLESLRARMDDGVKYDSDVLNAELDGA